MITADDFRRIALAFPHAIEKPHFERTSFRVDAPKGKIFATMLMDGASANLMLSRDEQDMLCAADPDVFMPVPNKWGEKGATTLLLANTDEAMVQSGLRLAWLSAAPPKVRNAFPDDEL